MRRNLLYNSVDAAHFRQYRDQLLPALRQAVDRIGQHAQNILCYSFLPADGVEGIIRLRNRVRQRLSENAEVVGSDEAFSSATAAQPPC